jgi:hypothetical protein
MIKILLLLFVSLLLSGCQSLGGDYVTVVKKAYHSQSDIVLTKEEIKQRNRPSAYLKMGGANAQVVVTLAVVENNQAKWVTADRNVVVLQNGRLVRIVGLDQSPSFVSNLEFDPLRLGVDHFTPKTRWQRFVDFKADEKVLTNYRINATYQIENIEYQFLDKKLAAIRLLENNVSTELGFDYQNEFVFDRETKKMLYTRQFIAPKIGWLEMTFIN